jgi:glycosyltransferase involved in cell wall biosynthesis
VKKSQNAGTIAQGERPQLPAANAAIYYQHEAFTTALAKLMGRNAAGAGFLSGFARHADVERFIGYARTKQEFEKFREHMGAHSRKPCAWLPHGDLAALEQAGTLFVYAPGLSEFCWQRRFRGDAAFSVVGLTHTISSDRVMEDFGNLLVAPVEPWDALVCTSQAVKKTLEGVLAGWGEYLAGRFGAPPPAPRLKLPVIPLGVDCDAFAAGEARGRLRAQWRRRHAIGENDVAFMFLGRLSFHAKAHPLPMYLALEAAAARTKKKLAFILCGYFFNDSIRKEFLEGARRYCPSVRLVQVDGRKPAERAGAWAAADVFTSFSDNIQESFGLAPVEAMAAGLPAVVSDWDGYRDTVADGETALCVPTAMPEPGHGEEFALRYLAGVDTYDLYIGNAGQCTAVDVGVATDAYVKLIEDPGLRARLGEAGRKRARRLFDWPVIVRAYQQLWAELAEVRRAQAPRPGAPHPLRDDPFRVFRGFPSFAIGPATLVERASPDPQAEAARIAAAGMNNFALRFMLSREEFARLFEALGSRAKPAAELEKLFAPGRRSALYRTLGWLAKGGVVNVNRRPG